MLLSALFSFSLLLSTNSSIASPKSTNSASLQLGIPLSQIYIQKNVFLLPQIREQYVISNIQFIPQTFNNCGPAALAMILDHFGTPVSQERIAEDLRPFNTIDGGVDDKAVFPEELVNEAQKYGYEAVYRPNGSKQMLQMLVANDIPIIVRSWLDEKEDIGHYKIVKGYDAKNNLFIINDSFTGPDKNVSFLHFDELWKPFNYTYVLVYPKEKTAIVRAILGENINEKIAWNNALQIAKKDAMKNSQDTYAYYNQAIANYYLGNYKKTIEYFEKTAENIPERMLWYQPEPIFAYKFEKKYNEATKLANSILDNGNTAFSELYKLKGDMYREQGQKDQAKENYILSEQYNKNYLPAREALKTL